MSPSQSHKFLAGFLVLVIAFLLWSRFGYLFNFKPDFVFASLIALSFFLGLLELLFLILLSVFLMNWQPILGVEMMIFSVVPIGIFLFRKIIFPLEGWLSNLVGIVLGLIVFYGLTDLSLALAHYGTILKDIFISALFGFLIFGLFDYFYGEEAASQ